MLDNPLFIKFMKNLTEPLPAQSNHGRRASRWKHLTLLPYSMPESYSRAQSFARVGKFEHRSSATAAHAQHSQRGKGELVQISD